MSGGGPRIFMRLIENVVERCKKEGVPDKERLRQCLLTAQGFLSGSSLALLTERGDLIMSRETCIQFIRQMTQEIEGMN